MSDRPRMHASPDGGSEGLSELVRLQRKRKGLTIAQLSRLSGLPEPTVAKALAAGAHISPAVAAVLAGPLEIDPVHAVLAATSEQLARNRHVDPDDAERHANEKLAAAKRSLDQALAWQGSARFAGRGSGRRLAFRAFRLGRDGAHAPIMRPTVAEHLARVPSRRESRRSELEHELLAFEHDRLPTDRLSDYVAALNAASGRNLTMADLDAAGERLRTLHRFDATCDVNELTDRDRQRVESTAGHIELARTATVFGSINVETLTHVLPRGCNEGTARIINAQHDGFELVTVLAGRVRLVQTARPVDTWAHLDDPTKLRTQNNELLSDEVLDTHESVGFPSGTWHHAELLSPARDRRGRGAIVRSFNITGNVWLHRRFEKRRRP